PGGDDHAMRYSESFPPLPQGPEKLENEPLTGPTNISEIILLLHEAHSEFPDIQPEDHNSVVRWQKVKQYFQSKQLPIPHNDIKLLIPSLLKYIDLSVE
ncbi:MAG: hypothetical protein ACYCR5_02805, partial [Leptospirillum sp.]